MKKKIAILVGLLLATSVFFSCKQSCNVCGGSGDCIACQGKGKFLDDGEMEICDVCYGSGECTQCSGKGKLKKKDNKSRSDWIKKNDL